jgi:competence protein ComFC
MSIEIKGNWKKGFALDLHTKSSIYLGPDAYGYAQYDTTRTEIGQLVYDLKYNNDQTVISKIIEIILTKITGFEKMNVIIPVPPSKHRENQPVYLIADALSAKTNIPVVKNEIIKIKETPELKGIM